MSRKSIPEGENEGIKYEKKINNILKFRNIQLKTTESAGASDLPDGYFWYNRIRYPIEIKRTSGDFAQVELNWDQEQGFFYSPNSKNFEFMEFLSNKSNFLETINNKWTQNPRWFSKSNLSEKDRHWDLDHFVDIKKKISVSYIENFYNLKNPPVHYIQIENRGFFFMGEDVANLGVPRINGKPYLRARVKTRSSKQNKWGFLVAIKMPYIKPSTHDIEELNERLFPIAEGDHIQGRMDEFL